VENLVYQLPAVSLVAAVAMPDEALGERVCVYAVLHPDTTLCLDDLQAHMEASGVARFKWPERLVVTDQIQCTPVGKLDKKALRMDISRRLRDERGG